VRPTVSPEARDGRSPTLAALLDSPRIPWAALPFADSPRVVDAAVPRLADPRVDRSPADPPRSAGKRWVIREVRLSPPRS